MNGKQIGMLVAGFIVVVIGLSTIFGSFYTINQTERGVLLRNGAVVSVIEPGLSYKVPFIDSVARLSVQNEAVLYRNLMAYSKDQQGATVNVSVSYHVPPADVVQVYSSYKTVESMQSRLIDRQVPTQLENVFGKYNAVEAVQNRVKFVQDVTDAIRDSVAGAPVIIDSVQVENIDFSKAYEDAVEARMTAEVAVKTRQQQLQTEQVQAQIVVTQAQAEADSQLARAKADAEAIVLKGDAEASAIRARAEALAANSNLVELTKAERWDGKLPSTVVPNGAMPFIDVKK